MISIEKLKNIKKIVVHKNCHDGTASALIIKNILPDVEVFFADYKDPEYFNLKAEPGILFCDIAPPPKRAAEFMKARSIVLDHHAKTEKVVRRFQQVGLGEFGDNIRCQSGAVLAYIYVWNPLWKDRNLPKCRKKVIKKIVGLAGIRDTFKTKSPKWRDSCIQAETLHLYGAEYFLGTGIVTGRELKIGEMMHEKFNETVKRVLQEAYILDWKDFKVAIVPGHRVISDVSEELRKLGVSITLSFTFKNKDSLALSCSARSDPKVFDCNKFCAKYGGGGHVPAAGGLTIPINKDTLNPYSVLENVLKEHGESCLIK